MASMVDSTAGTVLQGSTSSTTPLASPTAPTVGETQPLPSLGVSGRFARKSMASPMGPPVVQQSPPAMTPVQPPTVQPKASATPNRWVGYVPPKRATTPGGDRRGGHTGGQGGKAASKSLSGGTGKATPHHTKAGVPPTPTTLTPAKSAAQGTTQGAGPPATPKVGGSMVAGVYVAANLNQS